MVDKINAGFRTHQTLVSQDSSEDLKSSTNKELRRLDRSRNQGATVLEQGRFSRFIAHALNLGSRTDFVTQQNQRVVQAFTKALERGGIEGQLSTAGAAKLNQRVAELNAKKELLTFADLDVALAHMDDNARDTVAAYLPVSIEGSQGLLEIEKDGAKFQALAQKHQLDTPELKERFRQCLEARILGTANDPNCGPAGAFHYLNDLAEEAASGLRPSTWDKPVQDLFKEFPPGLTEPKFLRDGPFQVGGKVDGQCFIFFKRTNESNIPYDAQGVVDRLAASRGESTRADTPAARNAWADARQKFHFSVDKNELQQGKAWPLLHKLLTSDDNPFLQWKIGNPGGLEASRVQEAGDIKHAFEVQGPKLYNPAIGRSRSFAPIPELERKVKAEQQQLEARKTFVADGTLSAKEFQKAEQKLAAMESELNFVRAQYAQRIEDLSDDRCVDGAQFTLYTQHEPGTAWKPEEVAKYTQFLKKLENVLSEAGIPPGKLPASDVTVAGLSYATFRDEEIGEKAQQEDPGMNYQNPPESLRDRYRATEFFQLANASLQPAPTVLKV